MKKLVIVLILLAVGGGGAYYYYTYGKTVEKPQVVQTTITQGPVTEVVQATGTLEALRTVAIGSQVSGTVKDIYVDFNSIVKAGKLLAELDPQLLQVQVDLQSANVERQKGEIASQEVQLLDTQKQLERTQQMAEKGLANQQQLDQAILTVKTRTTAVDSARKQLVTNQANLDQAKLNVSYTKIYAPIDGVVVDRRVDRGQTVQASMTTPQFFTIATDLRQLKLTAGVDEAEIGKIRKGMPVQFSVETYPNQMFSGEVEQVRLNATTQNNVVTYPVWINAPNPDLRLRPSLTATVRIIVQTEDNVIRVPNQALRFRPTSDMYTALGLTPPQLGQGRGVNAGGRGDGGAGAPDAAASGASGGRRQRQGGDQAVAGAPPSGAQPSATPGAAGRDGQGRGQAADAQGAGQRQRRSGVEAGAGAQARGGRGEGAQGLAGGRGQGTPGGGGVGQGRGAGRGGFANMTPEERERMRAQFAGGRGGRPGGPGAGGRNGGARGGQATLDAAPVALDADKIDDLFAPTERRTINGQVWTWDADKKELKSIRVTTGINDGTASQLVNGDLTVGQQVVTNIVLPITAAQRQNQSIFGQQPNRGGGGFGPAPLGGGGDRGPGGGGGGGGGGRGGGGGGGGRGGGN
ncbi:MAG: efflux RND transporter periplasmic adaptor subunit [Vicinamibacterales bacterium]